MNRKKIENYFRYYFKCAGINPDEWQCLVRCNGDYRNYKEYHVKFYWSNGYFVVDNVIVRQSVITSYANPVLFKI